MKKSADDSSEPPPSSWAAKLDPRLRSSQQSRSLGSWADALKPGSWVDALQRRSAGDFALDVAMAASLIGIVAFYRSFLRRIPQQTDILPWFWRRRSLLGTVTSVGDGDGFRMFHTPGGRLAGWGWLRKVPTDKKDLRDRTISIRLAGVDAPEGSHFGHPGQPFAAESLEFLTSYILGRRVRAYLYRRDQYERVVATAFLRRPPFFFPRRDVGLELLRRGLATVYEGKVGIEFGGAKVEARYRAAEAEAKRKKLGMWGARKGVGLLGRVVAAASQQVESPAAYKARWRETDALKEANGFMRKLSADSLTGAKVVAKKTTRTVSTLSRPTKTTRVRMGRRKK